MKTLTMPCADEAFTPRQFHMIGKPHEYEDGKPDYSCSHCGWMQSSAAAGARELLNCATWHSDEARLAFIEQAKQAVPGFTHAAP